MSVGRVSERDVLGGRVRSRNEHRRRQKEQEDGKGDRQSTERIRMTDRDTDIKLEAEIAGEDAGRCRDGWQGSVYGRAIWLGVAEQGK